MLTIWSNRTEKLPQLRYLKISISLKAPTVLAFDTSVSITAVYPTETASH
jgi:hypothetical protein